MRTDRVDKTATDRLRAIAWDAASVGVVIADAAALDCPIVDVNPAFERATGYARDEAIGRNARFLQGAATDAAAVAGIRAAVAAGRNVTRTLLNYRRDGSRFWNELRISPIHNPEGRLTHFVCVQSNADARVRAIERVRADAAAYRALIDATDEGFCVIEVLFDATGEPEDYRFLEVNPAFERQTGLRDAVGRRMRDIAPHHERHWFELYGRVARTGVPQRFEHRAREFGERWYDVLAFRVGEPSDRRVGVLFSDVTARRAAEDAIRSGEQRLRLALDAAQMGVYAWDPVADRTDADDRLLAIVGLQPGGDFSFAAAVRDYVHADDLDRYQRAVQALVDPAGDGRFHEEIRWTGTDGVERWLAFFARATFAGVGDARRLSGIVGAVQDVTERRLAEAVRRADDARFRAVWESTSDAIALSDPEGNLLDANPAGLALFGYDAEEVVGKPFSHAIPDAIREVTEDQYRATFAAPSPQPSYAAQIRRKDGELRDVEIRSDFVVVDGVREAMVSIIRDVTERNRREAELRAAKEAAEEADRLKSSFLATMSHELRTPLTAIMGFAGVLLDGLDGPLTPRQAEDVASIAAGADRLLALVNDVLDLSRIQAGMTDLNPAPLQVTAAMAAVAEVVGPLAAAKGIDVVVEAAPGLSLVADPLRLHQVLLNLAGNAVKFTDAGTVTLSARAVDDGNVEIAVADTGIGIAPEALPHIFDAFRQADDSATRRYGGSGLGLAIVRRLVEAHGGTVSVASTQGAGSRFVVTLPRDGLAT